MHRTAKLTTLSRLSFSPLKGVNLAGFCNMIEKSAIYGRKQISAIEILMSEMGLEIQEELPKVYSKDLLEVLFKLPYTKRSQLEKAGLGNIKTVGNYLLELESAGFLRSEKIGKEKLYLNYRLLEILSK